MCGQCSFVWAVLWVRRCSVDPVVPRFGLLPRNALALPLPCPCPALGYWLLDVVAMVSSGGRVFDQVFIWWDGRGDRTSLLGSRPGA